MHLTTATFVSLLGLAAIACALPTVSPRQDEPQTLQPWQLNSVVVSTTASRPGAYPWSYITASLVDPNELLMGTSPQDGSEVTLPANGTANNCQAKWLPGESPTGRSWPCDWSGVADGYWTMQVLDTPGWTTANFDLKFTRVADMMYRGPRYTRRFEGTVQMRTGWTDEFNMWGTCGGSGNCNRSLKDEKKPFPVQQAEIPVS